MSYKKPSRFLAGAAAFALIVSTLLTPLAAMATTLTISQDGPNQAIDNNLTVGTGEWRLNTHATALTNTNGTPANVSLVFAYTDSQNYYYANYASGSGAGLSGVYKITNGVRSTVATYASTITASQTNELEIRHKDGAIRVYQGTTFLYKASNVVVAGTKIGVATVAANATFADTVHILGSATTPLNLSLVGGDPTPPPTPTPPAVTITAPTANATVGGTQTVTATATDAQAVSSVQFKLDGANLGAADTTAPYATSWNTTTSTNATHTLSAVATNTANLSTTASNVTVTVNNPATPPPTSGGFTVTAGGQNAGLNNTLSTAGVAEWRLSSHIIPTAGSGNTPANFSLVFGYTDAQNFYYANFAAAAKPGLSGVYKVTDGVANKLVSYNTFITPGQAVNLEVRYKDNAVRLYFNGTYLTKAEGITLAGNQVGVAATNATATFETTTLKLGTPSYAVALAPADLVYAPYNPYACLPTPSNPERVVSTGRQVAVSNSAELKAAILDAQPGDTITMADGTYTSEGMMIGNYTGTFAATADGNATSPITLTGSAAAVIDGNGTGGRYGLYLNGANHWNLVGFTVSNAAKGIVLDGSTHVFFENMHVTNIGQEAIHLRGFSADNVVKTSQISATGRSSEQFGEGVYIGSANSTNWGLFSGGQPDASSRNIIIGNTFTDFTAEAIDVKEGTSANYIAGNYFEGSSLSGQNSADSWIDVKGRCNLIEGNAGQNTLLDAYQVSNVFETWASYNVFRNNSATVNAAGYGFALDYNSQPLGNIVECTSNVVLAAGAGYANVPCTNQGDY